MPGFEGLQDLTYHHAVTGGIARVALDRPEVRNAFRPETVDELLQVLTDAAQNRTIGVVLLTRNGPSPKDGVWAFCSGGDQRVRGKDGYRASGGLDAPTSSAARPRGHGPAPHPRGATRHPAHAEGRHRGRPRLGRPAAGTRSHVVCDLTIASRGACPLQADGRDGRLLRRRIRERVLREAGRTEVRARGVLPRGGVLRRPRLRGRRGQPGRSARRARVRGDRDGASHPRAVADGDQDAQVRDERRRRRPHRPAGLRR